MTLTQFLACDELDQLSALWKAELIEEKNDDTFTYSLYKLDDFYVRVKVFTKDKSICSFECIKDPGDHPAQALHVKTVT
ncbi:hypothetical protein [Niabella aurantiaca]|uniref:hypothetical protein n=1 Tax=Niabella aurantiaca TaxID=379900 RepID=UPI0003A56607|nr:hypothetical protein [Niabella aurantiaca]